MLDVRTPKLNRDLLRDFSTKKLNISKSALQLIILLTPYVDRDGRVHFDEYDIRRRMYCEKRTFQRAMMELCNTTYNGKKLLTFENGYYVSGFHVSSNGEKTYQKHLKVLESSDFQNLTLNQTRLFLYILTSSVHNQYKKVAIENLYNNSLHDEQFGLNIYDDYKSLSEDLFTLLDRELISIRLPKDDTNINYVDMNPGMVEEKVKFHHICGFINDKKNRTSKYRKMKHVIGLKVHPKHFKESVISNVASEMELRLLAERYQMFHEDFKEETIKFFISEKNSLMKQFGYAGLAIYRTSLEKYFKEKNVDVLYFDLLDKAKNYFTDFYLLEEIKEVILAALRIEVGESTSSFNIEYPFFQSDIPQLIEYFVANSSDEHKILIDQDIQYILRARDITKQYALVHEDTVWENLKQAVQNTYSKYYPTVVELLSEECEKNNIKVSDILTEIDLNATVLTWAKQSVLSKQKDLEEEIKQLKQVVRFFSKKQNPFIARKVALDKAAEERRYRRENLYYNYWEEEA